MSQRRSLNSRSVTVSTNAAAIEKCIRFILGREGSKLPVKRVDIANHLATTCETLKNEVSGVIVATERDMNRAYGYCLEKVDMKSGAQYIVVLEQPSEDSFIATNSDYQILLNAALAHIFMSGGSVKYDDLWKFLKKANLMAENDDSVRNLFVKNFYSQLYITCGKRNIEDRLSQAIFQWGPRANKEVSKMFILQKVAAALGQEPEFWSEQYEEARRQENATQ